MGGRQGVGRWYVGIKGERMSSCQVCLLGKRSPLRTLGGVFQSSRLEIAECSLV